jgi:hypothetical protein
VSHNTLALAEWFTIALFGNRSHQAHTSLGAPSFTSIIIANLLFSHIDRTRKSPAQHSWYLLTSSISFWWGAIQFGRCLRVIVGSKDRRWQSIGDDLQGYYWDDWGVETKVSYCEHCSKSPLSMQDYKLVSFRHSTWWRELGRRSIDKVRICSTYPRLVQRMVVIQSWWNLW